MRRKTLDEMVVRIALESKKYLDNKELPHDERKATYHLLQATAAYAATVGYKSELINLIIDQYEDDMKRRGKYGGR